MAANYEPIPIGTSSIYIYVCVSIVAARLPRFITRDLPFHAFALDVPFPPSRLTISIPRTITARRKNLNANVSKNSVVGWLRDRCCANLYDLHTSTWIIERCGWILFCIGKSIVGRIRCTCVDKVNGVRLEW